MKRLWKGLGLLALTGLLGACSLTLDFGEQCVTSAECNALGSGLRCSDEGLCIARDFIEPKPCAGCEPNSNCDRLYGVDPTREEAGSVIMLGAILPRTGELATYGNTMDLAVFLAVEQINQQGGVLGRKIAVLSCDSASDIDQSRRAARHLVDTAQVSAVIGDAGSAATIETFTSVLRQAGVLLMSPSATSPALTYLADDNLLWRTAPSDSIQGLAIAKMLYFDFVCSDERVALGSNAPPFRVGLAARNDAYGTGLANRIRTDSCSWNQNQACSQSFNCGSNLRSVIYEPTDIGSITRAVSDLKAYEASNGPLDLVILAGYADDGVAFMQQAKDTGWRFMLTDGMRDGAVLNKLDTLDSQMMCKALGTSPASPSGHTYTNFVSAYLARHGSPPGPYAAHAYDAVYLIAHGAASAIGTGATDLTGHDVARGLTRLSDTTNTAETSLVDDFMENTKKLEAGQLVTLNIVGASGPLDFDNSTGEAPAPINVWHYTLNPPGFGISDLVITEQNGYTGGVLEGLPVCGP